MGANPVCVAVGDFSGNGKLGIVTANHGGESVSVLLSNGDGTFEAAQEYLSGTGPEAVAVGDFTGNGRADIAVTNTLRGSWHPCRETLQSPSWIRTGRYPPVQLLPPCRLALGNPSLPSGQCKDSLAPIERTEAATILFG
jgi:hypothetical protein